MAARRDQTCIKELYAQIHGLYQAFAVTGSGRPMAAAEAVIAIL